MWRIYKNNANPVDRIFYSKLRKHRPTVNREVWEKISTELNEPKRTFTKSAWKIHGAIAAVLLMAMATGIVFWLNNTQATNGVLYTGSQLRLNHLLGAVLPKKSKPVISQKEESGVLLASNLPAKVILNRTTPILVSPMTVDHLDIKNHAMHSIYLLRKLTPANNNLASESRASNSNSRLLASADNAFLASLNWDQLPYKTAEGNSAADAPLTEKANDSEVYIDKLLLNQLSVVQGWHAGIKGEFNNTWIFLKMPSLNAETPQITYKFNAGKSYGILAGYDFNNSFGLQAEWHFWSRQAQALFEQKNGHVYNKDINLTYMHFPVVAKFKWNRLNGIGNCPLVMNYLLGLEYGVLRSAKVSSEMNDQQALASQINRKELAVVGGINYDLYLSDKFFLSVGGRAAYGNDITKTTFSDLVSNQSRNLRVGLEASLHYKIGQAK